MAATKPRIISLLLVTTVAPMFVAGSPSLALVIAVVIGGYLMAGGANAVNMYLDRDIDDVMSRTRLRPIPGGRLSPQAVLARLEHRLTLLTGGNRDPKVWDNPDELILSRGNRKHLGFGQRG